MPEHRITGDEIHFVRSDGSSLNRELHGDNIDFITEAPIKVHNTIIPDRLNTDDIRNSNNQQLIEYSSDKINVKKPIDFGTNLVEINNISLEASQINKSTNSPGYTNLAGELAVLHQGVSDNSNQVFNLGSSNVGKIIVVGNPSTDMEVGSIDESSILTTIANKTITGTLTMGSLTAGKALQLDSNKNIITGDIVTDFADLTGGAAIGQIPDLPASKITEGAFADERIGPLHANKITSGTISDERLPTNIVRTDVANQTITSSLLIDGGTGDSVLTLKADSDNANESDNAFIKMIQDGGAEGSGGTRFTVGLDGFNDLLLGCDSNSSFFGGVVLQTNGTGTGTNQKPIIFKPQLSESARITQFGINLASGKNYYINGSQIDFDDLANSGNIDSARLNTEISPTIIPNLDAAKINSGTLGIDRIPTLTIGKIPDLTADKIASGELGVDRIPTLTADKIPDLAASKINSGELGVDRIPTLTADKIPSLAASKINSGTFSTARIPNLSASKINSGTLNIDRIPTITDAKLPTNILRDDVASQTISNTTANTELNVKVRSDVSNYNPVLKLSKHNNNDVLQEQLTMTLTDTALESNTDTAYIYKVGTQEKLRISGSSVKVNDTLNINDKIQLQGSNPGSNSVIQVATDGTTSFTAISTLAATTSASDLNSGTLDNSLLSLDANTIPELPASKITSGTFDSADRIPELPASKITSGTFDSADRIPELPASKITSGVLDSADRIPELPASKIGSGTLTLERIPTLTADKLPTTIEVDRINFNQASSGTDSTLLPKIFDSDDRLFFETPANKKFRFTIGGTGAGEITDAGLHDFIHCDLKSGGEYKIDGTQIDFDDIANSGNIDSARLVNPAPLNVIPNLDCNKIVSGTLDSADRIPELPASKITSGVLDVAQIPSIDDTRLPTNIIRSNVNNQAITANLFNLNHGSGAVGLILQANTTNLGSGNPVISLRKNGSLVISEIKLQDTDNALVLQTSVEARPIIFKNGMNHFTMKSTGFNIPSGKKYLIDDNQITLDDLFDGDTVIKSKKTLNSNSSLETPLLSVGYTRLQQVMKPADHDFSQIYKVVFHQMRCAGGYMNNDHLTGLGNSAKPRSYRYNSSVQPVLLGTHANDMNTFTKQSNPANGTVQQISIDFGSSDYDDQLNSFTTGVGFINWGHPGWYEDQTGVSNIRNKQNKICWLGTRADDAVNVTIDGVRIAATKYIGSESVSGTGNDDVYHMFVARGEISCIEIMYVGSLITNNNNTNSVELDFGVIGAF